MTRRVLLIEDDAINITAVDAVMERIIREDAEIVVGTKFEETNFYFQHRDRLTSIDHLRAQNLKTTRINLAAMVETKKTFAEVLSDPEVWTMPEERLTRYRKEIWDRLDTVL